LRCERILAHPQSGIPPSTPRIAALLSGACPGRSPIGVICAHLSVLVRRRRCISRGVDCGDSAAIAARLQGRSFLDAVVNAETRQDHGCTQESLEAPMDMPEDLSSRGRVAAIGLATFDGESALSQKTP